MGDPGLHSGSLRRDHENATSHFNDGQPSLDPRFCIIAIDFGTAFSGYAYSLKLKDQEIKHVKLWKRKSGADTSKTPTCILFDENEEFLDFGYKARDKYFEIRRDTNNYFFFKDFKMELYKQKVYKDLVIRDVNKKSMSALKVFSEALRFLKDDALETINNNTSGFEFTASDFTWVLTVPAIWDSPARQFMREAATEAGIVSTLTEDKLVIALEPEAASIRCKTLCSEDFMMGEERVYFSLSSGTQYIVVDCGGGTIDITVHEVLDDGKLKELHKASGNDKGGRKVDRKFTQCMREFFCDGLWEEYERDHPKEALQFMEDFVYFRQADHTQVRLLKFYPEFEKIVQKKKNRNENLFNDVDGISFHWIKQDKRSSGETEESYVAKLELSEQKMETFFHESLVHITDSLYEILKDKKGIEYILLVGGLSSSHILRKHIRREFDQVKVLCPKNPQEAIVNGAVMFGCDQSVISSRKSAFTYGVSKCMRFDPSKHKEEKKFTNLDGDWCGSLFEKMVEIDEDVGWNETREYIFGPVERNQKGMTLKFFQTEKKNATYVDEWGVQGPVASCDVDMPDITKGMNRDVKLEISFGFTEIIAKATDLESKSTMSVKMDFITK